MVIPFFPIWNVGLVKSVVFYKNWKNISRFSSRKCLLNDEKYGYDGMTSDCLYCFGVWDNHNTYSRPHNNLTLLAFNCMSYLAQRCYFFRRLLQYIIKRFRSCVYILGVSFDSIFQCESYTFDPIYQHRSFQEYYFVCL